MVCWFSTYEKGYKCNQAPFPIFQVGPVDNTIPKSLTWVIELHLYRVLIITSNICDWPVVMYVNYRPQEHTYTQNNRTHNFSCGRKTLEHFSSGQIHSCLQHVCTRGATHPTAWQVGMTLWWASVSPAIGFLSAHVYKFQIGHYYTT